MSNTANTGLTRQSSQPKSPKLVVRKTKPRVESNKHTVSLLVANKPGVLIRIALVFARRGYNIDSLVVSTGSDPNYSIMNIVASGDKAVLIQILKQLNKLIDVIAAHDRTGDDVIQKELVLFKISSGVETRSEILQLGQALGCEVVDVNDKTVIMLLHGTSEKLDSASAVLSPYGIIELVRTGKIIMSKGEELTSF